MAERYWLFKSEPTTYSYDDLVADDVAEWDGVRNFQVRNWLKNDIKAGAKLLFWHSSTKPIGVVGPATALREGYPDNTACAPGPAHPAPNSPPQHPSSYLVDIKAELKFPEMVTVDRMRTVPELAGMVVLKRGNRFSITPVTQDEYAMVVQLGSA